jgi:hypothetical protein
MSTAVADKRVMDPDLAKLEARIAQRKQDAAGAGMQPTKSRKVFTGAEPVGSGIAQGDVIFRVAQAASADYVDGAPFAVDPSCIPAGYVEVTDIKSEHLRLSGAADTIGNRHILESAEGVRMWRPATYDPESRRGPVLAFSLRTEADHPTHGVVSCAPGTVINIRYPREYNIAMKEIRRAAD